MTGVPFFNFPAFFAAQIKLEKRGYRVINPAQMDQAAGFNPATDKVTKPMMMDIIKRDLDGVLKADMIAMLPGWEKSKGAQAELAVATWAGIPALPYLP